jgi:hypothetical protein
LFRGEEEDEEEEEEKKKSENFLHFDICRLLTSN